MTASVRFPGLALTLLLVALTASQTAAQDAVERRIAESDSNYICILRNEDVDAFSYVPGNPASRSLGKTTAAIQVTFVNQLASDPWPQQAKDAVNYAAGIWAGILSSPVVIRIEASWTDLGSCDASQFSLASAGPQYIWRNYRNAPTKDTWYPDALADALHGADLKPGDADILAKFNRSCGPSGSNVWYFETDAKTPSGKIDLTSVALHEFAHGLGLFGTADVDDGKSSNGTECNGTDGVGCIGTGDGNDPMSYDRFTEAGDGIPLLSLSNPSTALGTALEGGRGGGLYFSGPKLATTGFSRARLYAPPTFNVGASYAHLDENTYNRTPEALMTPFLGRAEAIHIPGVLACGILADAGWTISGQCSQVATVNQPAETVPETFEITGPYPNPLTEDASFAISVTTDQPASVTLYDPVGRVVREIFRGVLTADRWYRFHISASELRAGIYFIRVSGAFGTRTRSVVVAR